MLPESAARATPLLLACPVCRGAVTEASGKIQCRRCGVRYRRVGGIHLLGPPFAAARGPRTATAERLEQVLQDAARSGWDGALERLTDDVLRRRLPPTPTSPIGRARARILGETWEDLLQDVVDPARAAWKFLVGLHPEASAVLLGPSFGATAVALARSCGHVVVFDASITRLRVTQCQARAAGLGNVTYARITDALHLPLGDQSVQVAVVPSVSQWFASAAGERSVPAAAGTALLAELRRVLAPGGQAWVGSDNRLGVARLLAPRPRRGVAWSIRGLRAAARAAGFDGAAVFAPLPFGHKFHQVLDVARRDRMNLSVDAYRTRDGLLRRAVLLWDRTNADARLERRLYRHLPALGAVLSLGQDRGSFVDALVAHLTDAAPLAGPVHLVRYLVRPKGVVLLALATADGDAIARLPLDERAEAACRRHHAAIESLAADTRIPPALGGLFPRPLTAGRFAGQSFFVESALAGDGGRLYYARPPERYDRAIVHAAAALAALRRATETPVRIDEAELRRLCGGWLDELGRLVPDCAPRLEAVAHRLRESLLGTVLPLGWRHGDYDFANLLYGPDDALTGIIDFEAFEPRGLPILDLVLLLARRPIRRRGLSFGALFLGYVWPRALAPLEAGLLAREMEIAGVDDRLYRPLALCCWLDHLRLRRDGWLVRSPAWRHDNVTAVLDGLEGLA